jgi:hypothetical protein
MPNVTIEMWTELKDAAEDAYSQLFDDAAGLLAQGTTTIQLDVDVSIFARLQRILISFDQVERTGEQRAADRVDGYDRDDLGESPDY